MSNKNIYKYGLYGRCPKCKEISAVKCVFCGEKEYFTDSSKPGFILCTNCNTHNKFTCPNEQCNNQPLILRTPKNEDEQGRILEFIKRKKDKSRDRRVYNLKVDKIKERTITEVEIDDEGNVTPDENLDKKDFKIDFSKAKEIALALEEEKKRKAEEEKEKDLLEQEVAEEKKPVEERRIVNQFYDQDHDTTIDKKINFPLEFKDTAYFNCHVCGEDGKKVACTVCGKTDQFSLDYDLLTCVCGNEMKFAQCDCGARHGIGKFYLKSGNIEWRYDKTKSYYRYRKGRMLAFSTCPSCGIFMVEKCKSCGSKVNFGKPNSKNEVYCKSCGTINQFNCSNKACNNIVKIMKNPSSIEEKYEWLNKAMDISEQKTQNKAESDKISFTNSFIEEVEKNTKEELTTSFIDEAEKEVIERKQVEEDVAKHNIKQIEYSFKGEKKGGGKVILIITLFVAAAAAGYYYYNFIYLPQQEGDTVEESVVIGHDSNNQQEEISKMTAQDSLEMLESQEVLEEELDSDSLTLENSEGDTTKVDSIK